MTNRFQMRIRPVNSTHHPILLRFRIFLLWRASSKLCAFIESDTSFSCGRDMKTHPCGRNLSAPSSPTNFALKVCAKVLRVFCTKSYNGSQEKHPVYRLHEKLQTWLEG